MPRLFARLKTLWIVVVSYFRPPPRPERTTPREPERPSPSVADIHAAGLVPPPIKPVSAKPQPPPVDVAMKEIESRDERVFMRRPNRKMRRFYEKERRKFDKFVEPQGPEPIHSPHGPRPVVSEPVQPVELVEADERDEEMIVDAHHSDKTTKVLFEPDEMYGQFCFRDTILDQLELYFTYIERMKRNDRPAYNLYKQIGAMLYPDIGVPDTDWRREVHRGDYSDHKIGTLNETFLKNRPSFGCLAYGISKTTEQRERELSGKRRTCWIPKFMYYSKFEKPPTTVQPTLSQDGDVYEVTVWWDKPYEKIKGLTKGGMPQSYPVWVSRAGKVIPLKMLETKMIEITSKKRDASGNIRDHFYIPQRAWRFDDDFTQWAANHNTTAPVMLGSVFVNGVNRLQAVADVSQLRVAVYKDDYVALFGIDARRAAYFFRDRDITLTDSGRKRRVFHIVSAHDRTLKDGSKTPVKLQFRGEKEFTWAGYRVRITVPGRDHDTLDKVNFGCVPAEWKEPGVKYTNTEKIGALVAELTGLK